MFASHSHQAQRLQESVPRHVRDALHSRHGVDAALPEQGGAAAAEQARQETAQETSEHHRDVTGGSHVNCRLCRRAAYRCHRRCVGPKLC